MVVALVFNGVKLLPLLVVLYEGSTIIAMVEECPKPALPALARQFWADVSFLSSRSGPGALPV